MPLETAPARALADKLLSLARKLAPGCDASVSIRASQTGNTRFAQSQITSSGDVEELELSVDVGFGLRHASASSNQQDDASLRELVTRAARLARLSPEDPERLPPLGAQKYAAAAPDAFDIPTGRMSADARATAVGAAPPPGSRSCPWPASTGTPASASPSPPRTACTRTTDGARPPSRAPRAPPTPPARAGRARAATARPRSIPARSPRSPSTRRPARRSRARSRPASTP
jgi:hypothetical protein